MSRVRRAITAFFSFSYSSINVILYIYFRECMPVESPSFSPNPGCVCVCVGGWERGQAGGCASARRVCE